MATSSNLSVGLGDALDLVLLLDGVGVGGSAGGVDDLVGEALGDGLEVAEGGLAGSGGDEVEGVVDAAEGGHVDGLATDDSGSTDTGGVLTGSGVDDGVNDDLDGVLVGEEVDDLEGVADDPVSHELLSVVAAVLHEGAGEALDDGAGGLAEPLLLVASGGVGSVGGVGALARDVVLEGDVGDLDVIEGPLSEKLDLNGRILGLELLDDGGVNRLFYVSHICVVYSDLKGRAGRGARRGELG